MKWSQLQSRFIHHEPFTASTAHRECATVRATGETACARARLCSCVQLFERVYSRVQQHTYSRSQVRVWPSARNRAWLGIARLGIARVARNYSGGSEPRAHGSQSRVARNHVQPHSADILPAHSAEQRGQEVALIVPPPPPLVPPLLPLARSVGAGISAAAGTPLVPLPLAAAPLVAAPLVLPLAAPLVLRSALLALCSRSARSALMRRRFTNGPANDDRSAHGKVHQW